MAASADSDSSDWTENEIDKLLLPKALKLCRKHSIELDKKAKLCDIKCHLKLNLLCKGRTRDQAVANLAMSAHIDDTCRQALLDIYDNTLDYATQMVKMDDPVVEELQNLIPGFVSTIDENRLKTKDSKAPILVLGETGAGKSSFINLLLGSDILPCSLLSNTRVICEIMYSRDETAYAILYPYNDVQNECKKINVVDGNNENFKRELAQCIQDVDKVTHKPIYKRAEIYLPCDILKSGLVIVDSPGIGDTKEMETLVLEYILNACTFIYVINSTSAGGVQARLQDLVHKVYEKALAEQRECNRPESAIFICNKWDQVPQAEMRDVLDDTVHKIVHCWPKCKRSQIFHFSTKEAAFIMSRGGLAPQFDLVLQDINRLVPLGREIQLLRGYRFLLNFSESCKHCFDTHLSQIELSQEQREKKQKDANARLKTLKKDIDAFFDSQRKLLQDEISFLAAELKTYINKPENMDTVCKFSSAELPRANQWKDIAIAVRAQVYDRIMKIIKKWEEKEGHFKKIGDKIGRALESQFPKFDAEMYAAKQEMARNKPEDVPEEDVDQLVPYFIRNKFEGLNFGMRVAVGIGLAPVFLVSMFVHLPVYGFKALRRSMETYLLESKFKADDIESVKTVSEEYARNTVEAITEKAKLHDVIEEDIQPLFIYIQQQQERMEEQIQNDLKLLRSLNEEQRSDNDILRAYTPLQAKFQILRDRLKHFLTIHLPALAVPWAKAISFTTIELTDTTVCSGLGAEIVRARSKYPKETGGFTDVCVRRTKEKIKPQNIGKYHKVEAAYSLIDKETIVKCFAVTTYEGQLYHVLEPLQHSLRSYLPHYQEDLRNNKVNTVLKVMKEVNKGLKFLHDKRLVHFDVSMDSVAVSMDDKIKLTNITTEKTINFSHKFKPGTLRVADYVHISPDFFMNKGRVKYRMKDDMYGVAVMMWELWVGEPVCDPTLKFVVPESATDQEIETFQQDLNDFQPKMTKAFDPKLNNRLADKHFLDEWWTCIVACLNRKMSSVDWLARWEQMTTYPKVSLVFSNTHFSPPPLGGY